ASEMSSRRACRLAASTALVGALLLTGALGVEAQRPQQDGVRPVPRGVLGGTEPTPEDVATQAIVDRLSLESYTELVHGLAEFGDREQGTEGNARATDWIEEQLRGWGYETARIHYEFEGEPREQVYATKIGTTHP